MSMNKMAIAELVAAVARALAWYEKSHTPATGVSTVTVLGVRRSWGGRKQKLMLEM